MGGGLAGYEDSGEVFLRRNVSSVRGRSYPALQELDTSSFLPGSVFGRDSKLQRYRKRFVNRIRSGLFRDGLRPARKEVRPVGRRIEKPENRFIGFYKNSCERANYD
jgi:hypothetical protein